jgi:hypothetical protein
MDDTNTPYSLRPDEPDEKRPRRRRNGEEPLDDEPRVKRRPRRSASSKSGMSTIAKIILWLGGIGLVFALLATLGIWLTVRNMRRAPFRKHMSEYLATPVGMPGRPGAAAVGKMVVVDEQDKDVDSLHFDLPDDLRAATPEEVVTVARLRWAKNRIGEYQGGGGAYQWSCNVALFDLPSKTMVATQHIEGSAPPPSFVGRPGESRTGDKPTTAVLNFLKNLPRKAAPARPAEQAPPAGNPPPQAPSEVDPALQAAPANQRVDLALLKEFDVVNGPWPFSKGNLGDPAKTLIRLNRVKAPRGLSMRPGTNTGARACYQLGGQARVFRATVGLADGPEVSKANVTFEVLGDGNSLWRSRLVRNRGDVQKCDLNVAGVKVLELRTSVDGPDEGANAVWIAVFVMK